MNLIERDKALDICNRLDDGNMLIDMIRHGIELLPSAEREIASVSAVTLESGVIIGHKCDGCNEPVAIDAIYCSKCGRRLVWGI